MTLTPHFTHINLTGHGAGVDDDGHPLHRWTLAMRVHGPTRGAVRDWLDQLDSDTCGAAHLSSDPVPAKVDVGGAYDVEITTLPLRGYPTKTLGVLFDYDSEETT